MRSRILDMLFSRQEPETVEKAAARERAQRCESLGREIARLERTVNDVLRGDLDDENQKT